MLQTLYKIQKCDKNIKIYYYLYNIYRKFTTNDCWLNAFTLMKTNITDFLYSKFH